MSPQPPAPIPRARFVLAGVSVWALVVLGIASQNYSTYAVKGDPEPFGRTLSWAINGWAGWLLLAPIAFWLARRYPVERPHVQRNLLLHVGAGIVITLVQGLTYYLMERLSGQMWTGTLTTGELILMYLVKNFTFGVLVYAGLVAFAHGIEYYQRFRERELRATQLSALLSKSELEVLKMQLQPHFLFNTLHAISALVHSDPDSADRIITRLGDLLRMSLQSNGTQEVPLYQELEFVEKYADIQRTRFRDRLEITVRADAEALDAMVPSLILQPLVENSIRHGVEQREERAVISVQGHRRDTRLILTVADNGPGFPDYILTPVPGRGLGLANTRARLAALYGGDGRLTVGQADGRTGGQGALVTIDIPYRAISHA